MKKYRAEMLIPHRCQLGEGPVWEETTETLYHTDILAGQLHSLCLPTGQRETIRMNRSLGCFALRQEGGFILGMSDGVYLRPTEGQPMERLPHPGWNAQVRAFDGRRRFRHRTGRFSVPLPGSFFRRRND